jgi:hypothetical protein
MALQRGDELLRRGGKTASGAETAEMKEPEFPLDKMTREGDASETVRLQLHEGHWSPWEEEGAFLVLPLQQP